MKKLLLSALCIAVALLTSCSKDDTDSPNGGGSNKVVPVESVSVTPQSVSVDIKGTVQLSATVLPTNATNKTVTWRSDDTSVATVDSNGLVTGVKVGSTNITATSGSISTNCKVEVQSIKIQSITLDKTKITMLKGGSKHKLNVTLTPEGASLDDLEWSTSNGIVTVDKDGVVVSSSVLGGASIVWVKSKNSTASASCSIVVDYHDIVVAGNTDNKACVWVNGVHKAVSSESNTYAMSVGGRYPVGYKLNSGVFTAMWWNAYSNIAYQIGNGTNDSQAFDVYYYSDLFIGGYQKNTSNIAMATVWVCEGSTKKVISLTDGTYAACVNAVAPQIKYLIGGYVPEMVYAVGYEKNSAGKKVAKVWILDYNTRSLVSTATLTGTSNAEATGVFVDGTDVYVVGCEYVTSNDKSLCVWKNGIKVSSFNSIKGEATDVSVQDGKIYVCGNSNSSLGIPEATYWVDGVKTTLPQYSGSSRTNSDAFSIIVKGDDVLLSGWRYDNYSCLWRNGGEQKLENSGKSNANVSKVRLTQW